jgi:hypothetical protein
MSSHFRSKLLLLGLIALPFTAGSAAFAHGSHGGGGEALEAGEFDFTPILSIEGHGGFDNNLEEQPRHYAIDGMFGGVFEWGLGNGGSFAIEAAIGPALVWGEAEHFYGKVHADDHDEDHDDHEDDHDDHEDDHEEHDHSHDHSHETDFKRTDIRGFLQARYAPNDRLSFELSWNPYYVTKDQGDDIEGLKNELGAKATWALGDGDVNFALGDGIEDLVNGVYLSVDHRQGWESDGMYVGNYTDPRVGLGFTFGGDEISLNIEAGPRFYVPGSYSGLDQRTDFAGEIELSVPVGDASFFLHWQQAYSWEDAEGWGEGWQHHVGTGVTFTF